jgi:hypothetical protein
VTDLFAKYDVPAPRYTSYPTVPFWTDSPTTNQWIDHLNDCVRRSNGDVVTLFSSPVL